MERKLAEERPSFDPKHVAELICHAVKACIKEIGTDGRGRPAVPILPRLRHEFEGVGSGTARSWVEEAPFAAPLLYKFWSQFKALPEIQELVRVLVAYVPFFRGSIGNSEPRQLTKELEQAETETDRVFTIPLLIRGVHKVYAGTAPEEYAEEAAELIRRALHEEGVRCLVLSPIENFDLDGPDVVDLGDGLRLRRLTASERSNLAPDFGLALSPNAYSPLDTAWALEIEWLFRPGKAIDVREPQQRFDAVVTLLRLFKGAPVGYRYSELRPLQWSTGIGGRLSGSPRHGPLGFLGEPYRLTREELQAVLKLWREYRGVLSEIPHDQVLIAISRFNDVYARVRPEDKLIDCVIALEALLLGGARTDLAFRFALRGSMVFAETPADRGKVRAVLSNAYKERSALVHGGKARTDGALASEVQGLTRDALMRILHISTWWTRTYAKFLGGVDDYLVAREPSQSLDDYLRTRLGR